MQKISRIDAYNGMDEQDIKVMDYELETCFRSKGDKEMTQQFYLDCNKNKIVLKVYYDGEEVESLTFNNKGKLKEIDHER